MLKRIVKSQKITIITVQQWVREQHSQQVQSYFIFSLFHRNIHSLWVDWVLRLAKSERHWNCTAHFRYCGSIEYRDTWDGIVIVAPISGITQHYSNVANVKQVKCWEAQWIDNYVMLNAFVNNDSVILGTDWGLTLNTFVNNSASSSVHLTIVMCIWTVVMDELRWVSWCASGSRLVL